MTYFTKVLGLVLAGFSFSVSADCLSQSNDINFILDAKTQGQFRYLPQSQQAKVIDLKGLSFTDYLRESEQHIASFNPRAATPCPIDNYVINQQNIASPTILDLVKPYQLTQPNSQKVVVLLHGLTDSPYSFHDLSAFYHQQGFNVRTVLLPGHGTAAEHLRYVDYKDWQAIAAFAIEQSLNDFEQVYLGGFSTGAGLILDYMLTRKSLDKKLAGVMLFAPATKAKNSMSWLAQYIDYIPFLNWLDKDADVDFAKYESFPINAGAQVHLLMNEVYPFKTQHKTHSVPMFVAVPEHDMTIETSATLDLLAQWQQRTPSPLTLVYYGERANLSMFKGADKVKLVTPQCQTECDTQIQMAHTAIPNTAENVHYGEKAGYRNCGHYLDDLAKYNECKVVEDIHESEITFSAKEQYNSFKRLTYNPYYAQLTEELAIFLNN
ncbi:alpha/beta hydrolase [Pseudoalteromonas sp.]|uniref:alpha/beta hydrolase n=1 Tax=Pseudoalteromonas sp. TaxID=53249 RepID=UPI00356939B0